MNLWFVLAVGALSILAVGLITANRYERRGDVYVVLRLRRLLLPVGVVAAVLMLIDVLTQHDRPLVLQLLLLLSSGFLLLVNVAQAKVWPRPGSDHEKL